MKKCVYSGTFDPPTTGHEHIIKTCLKIFDEVVVAVMVNPQKKPLFTEEERITFLKKMFEGESRIKIRAFGGAAVDLLEAENTPFYVRGVRDCIDLDYEDRDRYASEKLRNDIITIYIPADRRSAHVSSSLVRNSAILDKDFSEYIPSPIRAEVERLLQKKESNNV